MWKVHRNFVLSYLVLVILPVLALLGILKYGRKLTAPISVGGVWKVETDVASMAGVPCGGLFDPLQDASIIISQSGKDLTLTWPSGLRETATGLIDGGTLTASFVPVGFGSSNPACGAAGALSLIATVDTSATPRSFSGTFRVPGCDTCGAAEVRAVRQESAPETSRR